MTESVGARFARALAAKDRAALRDLLAAEVDFRAMTPRRFWEAGTAAEIVDDVLLGAWFEEQDVIDRVEEVTDGAVGDRRRVAYRFHVTTPDGPHLVEQQAYYAVEGDRIAWLRVMCSGFVPVG